MIHIRPAACSADRDAIYRLRAAGGRSVPMMPPMPGSRVGRVVEAADAWPQTVHLLAESEGRCLAALRADGGRVTVTLSLEGQGLGKAMCRALHQPPGIAMPERILLSPGEVLFEARQPASALYRLQQGAIWLGELSLGPGELLGEMAILPGGRRLADAVAGPGGAEVCAIRAGDLAAVLDTMPDLRCALAGALSERVISLTAGAKQAKLSA